MGVVLWAGSRCCCPSGCSRRSSDSTPPSAGPGVVGIGLPGCECAAVPTGDHRFVDPKSRPITPDAFTGHKQHRIRPIGHRHRLLLRPPATHPPPTLTCHHRDPSHASDLMHRRRASSALLSDPAARGLPVSYVMSLHNSAASPRPSTNRTRDPGGQFSTAGRGQVSSAVDKRSERAGDGHDLVLRQGVRDDAVRHLAHDRLTRYNPMGRWMQVTKPGSRLAALAQWTAEQAPD